MKLANLHSLNPLKRVMGILMKKISDTQEEMDKVSIP